MKNTSEHIVTGSFLRKLLTLYLIPLAMLISHSLAIIVSTRVSLFPGADVLMNIVGTSAEIVAGLYGITLASYTFFLSRIDALSATDATLDYVVASIKNRFKYLIWYITVNVLMLLALSMILMYCPVPEREDLGFIYRLACNEFVLFAGFSIVLILAYSVMVIDPNCITKEAGKLKRRMTGHFPKPGSAIEFISTYDRILEICNSMIPEHVLSQLYENKGKRFELTLQLLSDRDVQIKPLIPELTRIHRYYECVVNDKSLSVAQEMCILASRLRNRLEKLTDPEWPA